MAIITCRECGKEYSDKAKACPLCACPAEISIKETEVPVEEERIVEETIVEETFVEESVAESPVAEEQRSTLDPENVALLNTLASKLKTSATLWLIAGIPQCYPLFIPMAVFSFRTYKARSRAAKALAEFDFETAKPLLKKISTTFFVFSCIFVLGLPAALHDRSVFTFVEQNKEALEKIGL